MPTDALDQCPFLLVVLLLLTVVLRLLLRRAGLRFSRRVHYRIGSQIHDGRSLLQGSSIFPAGRDGGVDHSHYSSYYDHIAGSAFVHQASPDALDIQ